MQVRENKVWACQRADVLEKVSDLNRVMADGAWALDRTEIFDDYYIVHMYREVPMSNASQHAK